MDESFNQEYATEIVFEPRRTLAQVLRWAWARRAEVLCAAMLLGMGLQMFAVVARKAITNDEVLHIPAGYYHLVNGDFQLNNEHPPLAKMWAALPLLLIQPNEAPPTAVEQQGNSMELTWGYHQRFWVANKNRAETIQFWTRGMMVVLSCGLGVLIFVYARDLFGVRTSLFAVALYTLEPTVLAHGHIVHTDIPAALAFLLFFFVLRKYLQARTFSRALFLGTMSGLALVTKFSMIVLLPVLAGLALAGLVLAPRLGESRRKILLHAGVLVFLILLVVNAAYRFQSPPLVPGDVSWVQLRSPETVDRWLSFFRAGSKIVPTYYLFGQYNVMLHNRDGHTASLLGQYGDLGWWYYFPVAFALKTSLPFLIVTLVALVWMLWRLLRKRDKRFVWLLVPIAIYAALSMTSHINIGIRHFLPVYPFLFIAAGALFDRLLRLRYQWYPAIALIVLACGWMLVEDVRAFPGYVPYMNQLASAHPHWWYLSDSNVEWGEDVRPLADYLHARGETQVIGALSGGWSTLAQYGINFHDMFPKPGVKIPDIRYVAIGASFLNGSTVFVWEDANGKPLSNEQRVNYLDTYRTRQPEAILGNSIYVYRLK